MRVVSGLDKLRGRGPPEKPALHSASGMGVGGFLKPFSASEEKFSRIVYGRPPFRPVRPGPGWEYFFPAAAALSRFLFLP
jgi:hypothetical protein